MNDTIKIEFPAKPDYILAVRLAVSAVAERAGFDVEDIEDLKVATAEACMLLMGSHPDAIAIDITLGNGMHIGLNALGDPGGAGADEAAELSRCLLEALVDECVFLPEHAGQGDLRGGARSIRIYKKL